ncbi:HK97 family phage prohead protease [Glaciecola petra]|uniref:HK97 family phage prohead protease n=1 Tax=Glaciecola petra TaxID=3075602 RepID=A0ABU2ZPK4_9ALTE|nr:HK97 family phage prohead protease [Aestuariibacter sp. P117]MDT0594552.1 HK97 family phage prohead protease [Aestuariibacter sp. P117]
MNFELRASHDFKVSGKKIVGRPVVYGSRSEDLGGFTEIIQHGAFGDSINGDIRALVEHDYKMLLGRTISNTMSIRSDDQGLLVEISPPDTRTADELMVSIERGDIRGMSFGFSVPTGGDNWDYDQAPPLRTVTRAVLHEITITSMPAYKATNVAVAQRSMQVGQVVHHQQRLDLLERI